MKCSQCHTDNTLKDRTFNGGRCKNCGHPFVFEPTALAGGWQVGSIVTLSTGTPFNGGNCGDLNRNFQGNRGDATGISPYPDNPTAQEYFRRDPTDGRGGAQVTCSVPDAQGFNELTYRQGNVARNNLLGPGVIGWDFSTLKNFRITERFNLHLRKPDGTEETFAVKIPVDLAIPPGGLTPLLARGQGRHQSFMRRFKWPVTPRTNSGAA